MIKHVGLKELIEELELMPPDGVIRYAFGRPRSYRGHYEDLAFEPVAIAAVADMLKHAKSALGATFEGYKGGDFVMEEYTSCWIAEYGSSAGDKIGMTIINLWRDQLGLEQRHD